MPDSAAAGMPPSPRRTEVKPSFITPPSVSAQSSSWAMTGMPNMLEYSNARLIKPEFIIGIPSSERATHPASCISPARASSLPCSPTETAPMGNTFARPVSRARSSIKRVTAALSFTGLVLAMHATEVTPPATADLQPEATVSRYS